MRLERDFRKILVITLVLTFSISFVFATAITDDIHLNLQTTFDNGTIQAGTFDFVFNISTNDTCDNIIYTNSTTLTTDTRGIISYYLPDVNLTYDIQYYLCYYRDGTLKDSSKIARTPYTFRARNITLSGVEIDQDLDMGAYNITTTGTGFFGWLGNLTKRITKLFVIDIDFNGTINGTGNISTTGNITAEYIGVGTTTPSQRLDVVGGIQIGTTLIEEEGVIRYQGNQFQAYNGTAWNAFGSVGAGSLWSQTGSDIYFNTGNVGIGTIDPNATLHVVGEANITGNLSVGGNVTFAGDILSGSGATSGAILNEDTSSSNPTIVPSKGETGYGIGYGSQSLHLIADEINVVEIYSSLVNVTKNMTVHGNLSVGGNVTFGGDILSGSGATSGAILNEPTSNSNPTLVPSKSNLGYGIGYSDEGLNLIADEINVVEIYSSEVNITKNVTVYGNITADYFFGNFSGTFSGNSSIWSRAGTNTFLTNVGDDVGIGTTTPQNKLNVIGDGNFTTGVTIPNDQTYKFGGDDFISYWDVNQSFGIGKEAGSDTLYSGAVGYQAGKGNTGDVQIAIGYRAGFGNTGTSLTAIGHDAGYSNTGIYAVAIGYNAGRSSVGNVAVGSSAGRENTGTAQTAIGDRAGYQNEGTWQTVVGGLAGYLNDGDHQIGIGINAGRENTGHRLNAFGYEAGRNNTGNDVIAIGANAGESNTGDDVVAIGYDAGKDNTVANQFIVQQANINPIPLIQGDFSSGFVGINTTSPQNTLNVVGDANITGLIYGNGSQLTDISQAESDPKWTANWTADQYLFNTGDTASGTYNFDSNTLVVDAPNDRVGIGTATPDANLEIAADSNTVYNLHTYNGGGLAKGVLIQGGNDGSDATLLNVTRYDGTQEFFVVTDGNSYFNNGLVGIGTASPSVPLEILKSGGVIPTLGVDSGHLLLSDNGDWGMYSGIVNANGDGWIQQMRGDGTPTAYDLLLQPVGGKVGIGTASPNVKFRVEDNTADIAAAVIYNAHADGHGLFIQSNGAENDEYPLFVRSTITPIFVVSGDGKVGIGTTSPTEKLDILGGNISIRNTNSAGNFPSSTGFIKFNTQSDADTWYSGIESYRNSYADDSDLRFYTTYGDTVERMRILSGGKVGIGTASPDTILHVEGSNPEIKIESDSDAGQTVLRFADSTGNLGFIVQYDSSHATRANDMRFYTLAGGDFEFGPGKVGIGTASPEKKLDIYGGAGAHTYSRITSDDQWDGILEFYEKDVARNAKIQYDDSAKEFFISNIIDDDNADLILETKDTPRLTIKGAGNIGIGTTNPSVKLDISSGGTAPDTIDLANSIAVGTVAANSDYKHLGQFGFVSADPDFSSPKMVAYISGEAAEYYSADADVASKMRFYTGSVDGTNPAERMVIDHLGYVGIGTVSPGAKLHVDDGNTTYGTGTKISALFGLDTGNRAGAIKLWGTTDGDYGLIQATTSNLHIDAVGGGNTYLNYYDGDKVYFGNGSGGHSGVWEGSTGNVGINDATPSNKLSIDVGAGVADGIYVTGTSGPTLQLEDTTEITGNVQVKLQPLGVAGIGVVGTNSNHPLRIRTNNTEAITIDTSQNVGIGDTNPSYKLDVTGRMRSTLGRVPAGSLHGYAITYDAIFDALDPSIPVTDDEIIVSGGLGKEGGILSIVSKAERTGANTIDLYYTSGDAAEVLGITDEGPESFDSISIAW